MKVLFWNTRSRVSATVIAAAAIENDIDIVLLAEPPASGELVRVLSDGERMRRRPFFRSREVHPKIEWFARYLPSALGPIADHPGVSIRMVAPPLGPPVLLAAVHLQSKMYETPSGQAMECTRIRRYVEDAEARVGHSRTVVVGDANMNPFEDGIVGAEGLHAVMSRPIARRGQRTVKGEERRFFYNPMWNHFGDRPPGPPGTYFYTRSSQVVFFWNMFDQVLVRPDLLEFFQDENVRVLTEIDGESLLGKTGAPDTGRFSDHLPVVFELTTERI